MALPRASWPSTYSFTATSNSWCSLLRIFVASACCLSIVAISDCRVEISLVRVAMVDSARSTRLVSTSTRSVNFSCFFLDWAISSSHQALWSASFAASCMSLTIICSIMPLTLANGSSPERHLTASWLRPMDPILSAALDRRFATSSRTSFSCLFCCRTLFSTCRRPSGRRLAAVCTLSEERISWAFSRASSSSEFPFLRASNSEALAVQICRSSPRYFSSSFRVPSVWLRSFLAWPKDSALEALSCCCFFSWSLACSTSFSMFCFSSSKLCFAFISACRSSCCSFSAFSFSSPRTSMMLPEWDS
mmetsp:Transcript_11261/g.24884  ORF Transcript_11261/g.24884 Transcript_11261/m.24884 type:complete len:305 (-) Transcript_11261:687-1601(-)